MENEINYRRLARAYMDSGLSVENFNAKLKMIGMPAIEEKDTDHVRAMVRDLIKGCRKKDVKCIMRDISEHGLVFKCNDEYYKPGVPTRTPALKMDAEGNISSDMQDVVSTGLKVCTCKGSYEVLYLAEDEQMYRSLDDLIKEIVRYQPQNRYPNWNFIKDRIKKFDQYAHGDFKYRLNKKDMWTLLESYKIEKQLPAGVSADSFIKMISGFREYAVKHMITDYCPIYMIPIHIGVDIFSTEEPGEMIYSDKRKISYQLAGIKKEINKS